MVQCCNMLSNKKLTNGGVVEHNTPAVQIKKVSKDFPRYSNNILRPNSNSCPIFDDPIFFSFTKFSDGHKIIVIFCDKYCFKPI